MGFRSQGVNWPSEQPITISTIVYIQIAALLTRTIKHKGVNVEERAQIYSNNEPITNTNPNKEDVGDTHASNIHNTSIR